MATIKDMAEEYGNMPYAIEYARDKQKGTKLLKQLAYRDGANAVLDELKTRLKEYKTNSLGEYFVAWDYINEIINELKGE